jgi:hypothetical protein
MRSGSTLLSHILASHPEFAGAAETHVDYKDQSDLLNLVVVTIQRLRKLRLKPSAKYVVDQVNFDYLTDKTLSSPRIHKCVILIRSPERTLQSLVSLLGWQETAAAKVYRDRLEALVHYGQILRERALLVEYNDLVDRTDDTLAALTNFFEVSQPFTPHYATHSATGGYGDSSINIRAGRIIPTSPHKINISAYTLTQASTAFRDCRLRLLQTGVKSVNDMLPSIRPDFAS